MKQFPNLPLLVTILGFSFFGLEAGSQENGPVHAVVEGPRHLEVLFLGDNGGHDPVSRFRIINLDFFQRGIKLTYRDTTDVLNAETLSRFDAVLLYANHGHMEPEEEEALVAFVENGGAFIPVHSASACFSGSEAFGALVGARFESHGAGEFTARIVEPEHPVMKGFEPFETWDETYVHKEHADDRLVLQKREDEPWTWVREQGEGRVFYTAHGHDERCWEHPGFQELLVRGILWAVGEERYAAVANLELPELEYFEAELPNYERRDPPPKPQEPLSPEDSMKLAQVPPGMRLELFASEPDIVNPIWLSWDERGRLWVVETIDYPNNLQAGNLGHDSIKILEDTNGDGRADKVTVFAEELSIPTTMVFANGGVVLTNGSEILFLKDTTGDDRADVREVLFDGIHTGDTHAGTSNFRYGLDGWIYATTGYSGFRFEVGGREVRFGTGVFRFRPDGSDLEVLQGTTNNTWGLGFTEEFDVVGSTANGNPSWYMSFPRSYYEAAGMEQPRTPRADTSWKFYPITKDVRQVDFFDGYTAAAGHAVYTSRLFPEEYWNRIAFVTEPTGHLIGEGVMERVGAGFRTHFNGRNIFASADAWASPVAAEIGPDGALWFCDWYNLIIQHNPTPSRASAGMDAVNGPGNAYVTPLRDREHGRIYRIVPEGGELEESPVLDRADATNLIAALKHPNQLWRLHAHRLLIENGDVEVAGDLLVLLEEGKKGGMHRLGAIHAAYVLGELGVGADEAVKVGLRNALGSDDPAVARAALANLPVGGVGVDALLFEIAFDGGRDAFLRRDALLAISRIPASVEAGEAMAEVLLEMGSLPGRGEDPDGVLAAAWAVASSRHGEGFLLRMLRQEDLKFGETLGPNILPNSGFEEEENGLPAGWSMQIHGAAEGPRPVLSRDETGGRDGGAALRIDSSVPADVSGGAVVNMAPGARYVLEGWVRTENIQTHGNGLGALMNVHTQAARTKPVVGTSDWTQMRIEFANEGGRQVQINCLFGGYGMATGTAWWDDVSLREIQGEGLTQTVRQVAMRLFEDVGTRGRVLEAAREVAGQRELGRLLFEWAGEETAPLEERLFVIDQEVHARGVEVYNAQCVACHMEDGKGLEPAFPPLAGADWVLGEKKVPINIVLQGLTGPIQVNGADYDGIMPPLADQLSDQEIADVLTYVRQSWTNDAEAVTAEEVAVQREAMPDPAPMLTNEDIEAMLE